MALVFHEEPCYDPCSSLPSFLSLPLGPTIYNKGSKLTESTSVPDLALLVN